MSKNPSWIQFSDDAWGEAVGPSEYDKFLDSLDAPTLPIQSLEPLPDHDAPLLLTWITEHLAELAADEQFRVIGPHGLTFHQHADKLMEVAHLDAARRSATGDLRDQLTRQHREAKQELDDFERSVKFQSALRYRLEAAGPAFERIAAATPENQAAVVHQQQAAARHEALKALIAKPSGALSQGSPADSPIAACADDTPQPAGDKDREPMLRRGVNRRNAMEAWVKWHAKAIAEGETEAAKDKIADDILARAERFGYESNTRPLSKESVMRMIPPGLTGGRGRKPGSQSKK